MCTYFWTIIAVYHCSKVAKELWWFVIADGGIKHPRDLSLWLVAGASYGMIWTVLAWTFESTWDILHDENGDMYKQNYGMASQKAVTLRNQWIGEFELARKKLFLEWISSSKIYLKSWMRTVGQVVDSFTTWLRSSMTYVGARNLEEFNEKAIVGVQTNAWYQEWTPHGKLKK